MADKQDVSRGRTAERRSPPGVLRPRPEGGYSVEFRREFDQSREEVFDALTNPERLVDWYAEADIDQRVGGKLELRFANSGSVAHAVVTEFDRPHVFEHVWVTGEEIESTQPPPEALLVAGDGTCGDLTTAASVIRFELTERGTDARASDVGRWRRSYAGTRLTLIHYVPLNPSLIPGPLARSRGPLVSETPAPDMVLATWDVLLDLLDDAVTEPGSRAMRLSDDRTGQFPWEAFGQRRATYAELVV
jgi:uncharacterized protein YndB with AHSA1/START domain